MQGVVSVSSVVRVPMPVRVLVAALSVLLSLVRLALGLVAMPMVALPVAPLMDSVPVAVTRVHARV